MVSDDERAPDCPNCGASSVAQFCAECGQRQGPLLPTVPEVVRSALHELFDLDARWARSTFTLLRHPGRLSVEWIEGRRATWTSPLRLYLLTAALFFAVLGLTDRVGDGDVSVITEAATGFVSGALSSDETSLSDLDAEAAVAAGMELLPPAFVLLLPLGAALLGGTLRSLDRQFVEHLVTLVHVHAFAFLAWAVVSAVGLVTVFDIGGVVTLGIAWYIHRSFQAVYGGLSKQLWAGVAVVCVLYLTSIAIALGLIGVARATG